LQALTADYSAVAPLNTIEIMTEVYQEQAKKEAAKPKQPKESVIQNAVISALRHHKRVAWVERINSGAFNVGGDAVNRGRFFRSGFVGCSDVIGQLKDGRFLAVEVKRPGGKLSKPQKAFLDKVNNSGGLGFVAYSVDDVLKALEAV